MRTLLVPGAIMTVVASFAAAALAAGGGDPYGGGGYGNPPAGSTTPSTTPSAPATVAATAATTSYRATLNARQEVPKASAPARAAGVFTATVTERSGARSIRWTLTFRRLSGKALAAHIHAGKPGVAGDVLVPLCGPCKSGQNGRKKLTNDQADVIERGGVYVNVHTAKNAAGEIRGQIKRVGKK